MWYDSQQFNTQVEVVQLLNLCIQHAPSTWTTFSLCSKLWSQKALSCRFARCLSGLAKLEISIYFCLIKYLFLLCQELICWAAEMLYPPKIWNIITSYPAQLLWWWPWDMLWTVYQATQCSGAICSGQLKKRKFFSYLVIHLLGPFHITFKHFKPKCPGLRLCVKICKSTFWKADFY